MDTIYIVVVLWQMLMPYVLWHILCLGRCYAILLADVVAIVMCGRCYNHQADGTACCLARWQMFCHIYCMWQMLCQLSIHVAIIV